MKNHLTSAKFDQIVRDHKEDPSVDTMGAVFEALWTLAGNILKIAKFSGLEKALKSKTNTLSYMVACAFVKMDKYDPDKGAAFNYFTTVMLCWIRQTYRHHKKYAELKAKYEEKIKRSENRGQKLPRSRK